MFIPGHYAAIFALLLLGESSVLFIYTTIGLIKQNPLPWMMPPPSPYGYCGEPYNVQPGHEPIMRGQPFQQPPDASVVTVTSISTVYQSASSPPTTVVSTAVSTEFSTVTTSLSISSSTESSSSETTTTTTSSSSFSSVDRAVYITTNITTTLEPTTMATVTTSVH